MNLFGEPDPPVAVKEDLMPAAVTRTPGWVFISNHLGPQGYHRVKTIGTLGSLVTVCGIVGRKLDESQRQIIECEACKLITP